MFNKTIYIRDASTKLATDRTHFTLRAKGRRIGRIPFTLIREVIVEDGVEVTRKALDRLGTLGIPVTFLGREGRVQARLVAPWKADASGRVGQVAAYLDEPLRLRLARNWVDAKLANSVAVLKRYLSNHRDARLSAIARELKRHRESLEQAGTLSELMGREGIAARAWFEAIGRMLRTPWLTFSGRNRRPPKDPGNAVLSYGYAVLGHQLLACVESTGVDPYVGFLHGPERRRPALVLDLLEPFRPALADRLMLRLLNLGTLKEEHFNQPDGPQNGVRITLEGRRAILEVLTEWVQSCDSELAPTLSSPGRLLLDEAERFAAHASARTLEEFRPFYLDEATQAGR